ncbi:hypothetical protein [Mucilaginibacter kameinonensis]|uniref:hypothetical protein n=1 Tax=Mucilaginibacter kameinonensis TaxID=452286 RepID=UPI000EF7CAB7|nr:hypothetical protein [Mucilaginibacter kameinonensis]
MKKYLIALVPLFLIYNVARAQWVNNGSVVSTSNIVGIGTNAPSSALSLGPATTNKKLFIYGAGNEASGFGQATSEFRVFGVSSGVNHISFGKYQLTTDSFTEQMRIDNGGNVGIGTTNPQNKLDVAGGITGSSESRLYLTNYTDPLLGTGFALKIGSGGLAVNGNSIFNDGISIGSSRLPAGYKFAVNGNVIATSVTVKLYAEWPDYVFGPNFSLPTLKDVKTYIKQNRHLPEIPSAKQVAQEGQDLGEMNRLLLKKVEELTLYLIENDQKDKEREAKKEKQLSVLERKVAALQKKLANSALKR